MRTNIVIDDELMAEAMQVTGINTKREVVEEALRVLVRTTQQKNVLALRGQVQWEGDLDAMRQGRYFHESKVEYTVDESNTPTGVVSRMLPMIMEEMRNGHHGRYLRLD